MSVRVLVGLSAWVLAACAPSEGQSARQTLEACGFEEACAPVAFPGGASTRASLECALGVLREGRALTRVTAVFEPSGLACAPEVHAFIGPDREVLVWSGDVDACDDAFLVRRCVLRDAAFFEACEVALDAGAEISPECAQEWWTGCGDAQAACP